MLVKMESPNGGGIDDTFLKNMYWLSTYCVKPFTNGVTSVEFKGGYSTLYCRGYSKITIAGTASVWVYGYKEDVSQSPVLLVDSATCTDVSIPSDVIWIGITRSNLSAIDRVVTFS